MKKIFFEFILCITLVTNASAIKPTKVDCDCGKAIEYKPLRKPLPIVHSTELKQKLELLKSEPVELKKMHKAIFIGDLIVQRHFNNDLYTNTYLPEAWEKTNGQLFTVGPYGWAEFRKQQIKHTLNEIIVCPTLVLSNVYVQNNQTVIRYQMVQLGTYLGLWTTPKNGLDINTIGEPLNFEVLLNENYKVTGTAWQPAGGKVQSVSHLVHGLKFVLNPKPNEAAGQTEEAWRKETSQVNKHLIDANNAAKVCAAPIPKARGRFKREVQHGLEINGISLDVL